MLSIQVSDETYLISSWGFEQMIANACEIRSADVPVLLQPESYVTSHTITTIGYKLLNCTDVFPTITVSTNLTGTHRISFRMKKCSYSKYLTHLTILEILQNSIYFFMCTGKFKKLYARRQE